MFDLILSAAAHYAASADSLGWHTATGGDLTEAAGEALREDAAAFADACGIPADAAANALHRVAYGPG